MTDDSNKKGDVPMTLGDFIGRMDRNPDWVSTYEGETYSPMNVVVIRPAPHEGNGDDVDSIDLIDLALCEPIDGLDGKFVLRNAKNQREAPMYTLTEIINILKTHLHNLTAGDPPDLELKYRIEYTDGTHDDLPISDDCGITDCINGYALRFGIVGEKLNAR